MKCKVCGGELKFDSGLYICQSCGNRLQISSYFENNEVFIAYIETDEQGRRTKDSIIAQDIYNKLQAEGVQAFYQRISADYLTGNHHKKAIDISLNNSKVILLIGTTTANYEKAIDKYRKHFEEKTIIPIYSKIGAYDIPKEISKLQAINYDNVGAITDIVNNTLHKLGKSKNIDFVKKNQKELSKRRKIILSFLSITLVVIMAVCAYLVFGTQYVLDSKKYDYAQTLESENKFVEAIMVYNDIIEYKDSAKKLDGIYDIYNGFFYDDSNMLSLHLSIENNSNSNIQVTKQKEDVFVNFTTSAFVEKDTINFEFTDSQKNNGKGTISLLNDGIRLEVNLNDNSEISVGEINTVFLFSNRMDEAINKQFSTEELFKWLLEETTEKDLTKRNIKLDYVDTLGMDECYLYRIQNTNYLVLFDNKERMQVIGIYASFDELFNDKSINDFEVVIKNNFVYIPANIYLGATNLIYELGGRNIPDSKSIYFVTSDTATTGIWEDMITSAKEFNSYNSVDGIKYHLEIAPDDGTDTRIGDYENLKDAIEDAEERKNEGYIVVNNTGHVVYVP